MSFGSKLKSAVKKVFTKQNALFVVRFVGQAYIDGKLKRGSNQRERIRNR